MPKTLIVLLAVIPVTCSIAAAQDVTLPDRIRVFDADVDSIQSKYRVEIARESHDRMNDLYREKLDELSGVDFNSLSLDDQVDYVLLRSELQYQLNLSERNATRDQAARKLLEPVQPLIDVLQKNIVLQPVDPQITARRFDQAIKDLGELTNRLQRRSPQSDPKRRTDALWAANRLQSLLTQLKEFHLFRDGYDPMYSWWCRKPYEALEASLKAYIRKIRSNIVGVSETDKDTIIGVPIGADGLAVDLSHEFINYTPDELIQIAKRELQWCHQEMVRAANDMGFGEDWRAALEKTKDDFIAPGKQPELIRELAEEATKFVEDRELVTVPKLCKEVWRMEMMTPERQRVNPYFTGGPVISISYPTDAMTFDEKMMSMRGNNPHFARATVHHELIPGHHLQLFMMQRYRPYRQTFRTPFWIEGWALYWEMRFWDLEFPQSPKNRMGMLFWRKHRAARIIFSLSYHTEKMTPEQCVDYLVENVGHERKNATAEVRRSVMGGYSPLYQAAYMLGGLQLRRLHQEMVLSGKMEEKPFHDMFLQQNAIPIELIRARMQNSDLSPDYRTQWRFDDQ